MKNLHFRLEDIVGPNKNASAPFSPTIRAKTLGKIMVNFDFYFFTIQVSCF